MGADKPFSQMDLTWDYDPVNGPTIPAPFFYDPSIFAEEKEQIFMKCWHLVGHVNKFNEPGKYIVQIFLNRASS